MGFLTPEYYQGKPHSKNYFEGWYFKLNTQNYCLAVIAGISTGNDDPHSFIQTLTSEGVSDYIRYPLSDFYASRDSLNIRIGNNTFSDSGLSLDIVGKQTIKGNLSFENIMKYPRKLSGVNIMGFFGYLPKLSCNHAVVHIKNTLSGELVINGKNLSFDGGTGYIEKDYGKNFPKEYFWMHSNSIGSKDNSVMVAIAAVPLLNKVCKITGILSFIQSGSKIYNISTYNGAKIIDMNLPESLTIKNRNFTLNIKILSNENSALLKSPVTDGVMVGTVTETLNANAEISFYIKNELIFSGESICALEYMPSNSKNSIFKRKC